VFERAGRNPKERFWKTVVIYTLCTYCIHPWFEYFYIEKKDFLLVSVC